MSAGFNVVIPARYPSTRLPGKPLADIGGSPMIVRVVRQALAAGAARVIVATDDARVVDAVEAAGCEARLTRTDHASGSDRVMEVVDAEGWADDALVLNVQGDEPLLPARVIAALAEAMHQRPDLSVGTMSEQLSDPRLLFDPNVVKVVCAADGRALYFSRAPIPYARDAFVAGQVSEIPGELHAPASLPAEVLWTRHIGLYAYRVRALRQFVKWPIGLLERAESLEQLRLLEHGVPLLVVPTPLPVPGGVDTPADLERVRAIIAGMSMDAG